MPLQQKGHPYSSQTSEASSSVYLQDLSQHPNNKRPQQYDSWESINHQQDHDLPEPVLPWMKSESRNSLGSSRSSVDATSLHIMKRQTPDNPNTKKKQRWTKHKWWLLLSNTVVK